MTTAHDLAIAAACSALAAEAAAAGYTHPAVLTLPTRPTAPDVAHWVQYASPVETNGDRTIIDVTIAQDATQVAVRRDFGWGKTCMEGGAKYRVRTFSSFTEALAASRWLPPYAPAGLTLRAGTRATSGPKEHLP